MRDILQRWSIRERVAVPQPIQQWVGGHPLVAETLLRRGFTDEKSIQAFLKADFYQPAGACELPGMASAADRIWRALRNKEKICVWGDFDVDGQTATTLLVSVLQDLGGQVAYHIPVRETESHGINISGLEVELAQGAQCILTCDTGIDAIGAVEFATAQGVDVIITDHHELPADLPPAFAIVNPHLLSAGHSLETLPGVGVAYKLAEALYERIGEPERAHQQLDLVALGIVADVAEQVRDTRYLLQRGLDQLRHTGRLGLRTLMEIAQIDIGNLSTDDIGFSLAPRLNALGRLGDASDIVEFLTTEDLSRARILASQLESLNSKRKLITDEVMKAAVAQVEREPANLDYAALVLANPTWPSGVIGIVANRLAELYQRPVVLFSTPDGESARGSARSVQGCDITEAIATQTALIDQYGGHEQAAGLSLPPEHIPAFTRGLSRAILSQLGGKAVEPPLLIDGFVSIPDLSLDFVDDLARLAPFGAGNPPLNLAVNKVSIVAQRKLGRDGRHMRLTVADEQDNQFEVVWWQWDEATLPSASFDLAFNLGVNYYRGRRTMQATWLSYRLTEPKSSLPVVAPSQRHVIDYRSRIDVQQVLDEVMAFPDALLWREGPGVKHMPGEDRRGLYPANTLIIWTPPASYDVLQELITQVSPERIILVAESTAALDNIDAFVRYLIGLVKFVMNKKGKVHLGEFAAAMGQTILTVRKGLAWLVARGDITLTLSEDDQITIMTGGGKDQEKANYIFDELKTLLSETAAYRRHFTRMDTAHFIEITG
jgi:single-stranded-DNA-specific exonuclease